MKKSICAFLCVALLVPFILIPVSAADDEYDGKFGLAGAIASGSVLPQVKFALYEDKFIYGGVEYPLLQHLADGFCGSPYFVIAPDDKNLCIVMLPFGVEDFSEYLGFGFRSNSFNDYNYYSPEGAPIWIYHFSYNLDNSLTFVDFYEVSNTYWLDFPITSYVQLKSSILCNRFPIYFWYATSEPFIMLDAKPVAFTPVDPLASDGFFYINDGSYTTPDFSPASYNHIFYSKPSVSARKYDGISKYYKPLFMMQSYSDLVEVYYIHEDYSDVMRITTGLHIVDGEYRYYYGIKLASNVKLYCVRYRVLFDDLGSVSGLEYLNNTIYGSGTCSNIFPAVDCYDLDYFLGNVLLCSLRPVYWGEGDAVAFWENPRGFNADPSYIPPPPLYDLLPQFSGGLNVTPDEFNSIFSSYFSGFTFMTSVFNIFLSVTPIRSILTISFGIGLILFVLNVVPSVASSISSSISRHNAKSDRSDNSSRHNSSRRKR